MIYLPNTLRGSSTIPINPVSFKLVTQPQVKQSKYKRMLEQKAALRLIHLPSHSHSQTNQLKKSLETIDKS